MPEAVVSVEPSPQIENPLRSLLESDRIEDPCSIVFFGASGDLFKRMLLPAVYNLRLEGILPANFSVIGFSRSPFNDESFRAYCKESVDAFSRSGPAKASMWAEFSRRISYITADFDDDAHFHDLRALLERSDKELGTAGNRLFYLSTPPSVFPTIVERLATAKLDPKSNTTGWTRIIVEKPFGTDLATARALQREINSVFEERHIYRIDHYLGKETVQDIMALRFANTIFEPIWNRQYVRSVQITASETLGVEQRGGYYESSGALRDMLQNHVMNLLALVAMEPPATSSADAIRNEKFKVLSAMLPLDPDRLDRSAARGQYAPGTIEGQSVPGYRDEADVNPASNTETFAALKLHIDNWRWSGVPFYLRSGKRLARKSTEIAVTFAPIPHRLFGEASDAIEANVLVMKIQPEEGLSLRFNAKVPGPKNHIRAVTMDFNYGTGFGVASAPAYERLIADAVRGDQTLFTRWDAVELAWEIVTPVLERWSAAKDRSFPNYPAGSEGPEQANLLTEDDGNTWRRI